MAAARTEPPPLAPETPDALRPLLGFLNSRPLGYEGEAFGDPGATATFLEACGFELAGAALSNDDVSLLHALRDALATVLDPARDEAAHAAGWQVVNGLAASAPVTIAFSAGPATRLEPTSRGAARVVERILADVHAAIADGRFSRLRLCAFEPCGAAFYDATRSRTQRWHSYAVCGNRVNVAAHRERAQRAASS